MKKTFHFTITDNETGEIIRNCDTSCAIAVIDDGEVTSRHGLMAAKAFSVANVVVKTVGLCEEILAENPELKMICNIMRSCLKDEEVDDADA